MHTKFYQSGQSLIEILFAIAIFVIGVVTVGYLLLDTQESLQKNIEFAQARLLAQEGIEASRSIIDHSFADLASGTHGLTLDHGVWKLSPYSSDDTSKFTRAILVSDIDPQSKNITSTVSWRDANGNQKEVSLSTYLTNWRNYSSGASQLAFSTTSATVSGTSTNELRGITIENTGEESVTIASVTATWDNEETLHEIIIDGVTLFLMPIPSDGAGASGDTLDIEDLTLLPEGGAKNIDLIRWSGSMEHSSLTLQFNMTDGSNTSIQLQF